MKIIRTLLLFLSLVCLCFGSQAQGRKASIEEIDSLLSHISMLPATRIEFRLTMKEPSYSSQAVLLKAAKKFYLEAQDISAWYNAKSLWVLNKETQEVNLSEPAVEDLAELSVISSLDYLLRIGFVTRIRPLLSGDFLFTAWPLGKWQKEINRIEIYTDKKYVPLQIRLYEKNQNSETHIEIQKISRVFKVDPQQFTFSTQKYPRCTLIDLR